MLLAKKYVCKLTSWWKNCFGTLYMIWLMFNVNHCVWLKMFHVAHTIKNKCIYTYVLTNISPLSCCVLCCVDLNHFEYHGRCLKSAILDILILLNACIIVTCINTLPTH